MKKVMERLSAAFQITDSNLESGQFEGIASVFGSLVDGWCPTIVHPGAFSKTLQERATRVKVLWQHNPDWPIGKPVLLEETAQGLRVRAQISKTVLGNDAMTLIRDGVVDELSIGFDPIKFDFDQQEGTEVRHLRELKLWEVSPVTFAADPMARITEANRLGTVQAVHAMSDTDIKKMGGMVMKAQAELKKAIDMHQMHLDDPQSATPASQRAMMAQMKQALAMMDRCMTMIEADTEADRLLVPEFHEAGIPDEMTHLTGFFAWLRETHEGKVLSSKNKTLVQDAIAALQVLLTAAEPPASPDGQALTRRVEALLRDLELDALGRGILVPIH